MALWSTVLAQAMRFAQSRWDKMIKVRSPQDLGAGVVFVTIGAAGLYFGQDLAFGSSARMGPGYFPTILSTLIIVIGLVLAVKSLATDGPPIERFYVRPLFAILTAILAFGS